MCNQLGVGVALNNSTVFDELVAQFNVVLDDSIMYERHPPHAMGMGVALAWLAMGGPAGVANAGCAGHGFCLQPCFKIAQFTGCAAAFNFAVF